jgi:glycolate oxidase
MNLTEKYLTLQEFVTAARDRLDDHPWNYIVGGTETETTQRRNRLAIDRIALRPRVLNDVSEIDLSCSVFGCKARLPVFLCPVGGLESFDADGALSVAKAASDFGVPMMLSSVSKWPVQQVQGVSDDLDLIFQLYARTDATGVDALVDQAIELNLPAFCITVDSAVYSRRERDIVARFVKPWRADGEGRAAHYQAALNWADIERIRKRFNGPLVLKGIATAEDARIALDHGVDVIYVSNHGGRQLDHSLGSLDVLPEVVDVAGSSASVLVDGGFCRGTDIAKAIALGADGVGLGRMMCLALAADSAGGVYRMLEILEQELAIALALLGVCELSELNGSHVTVTEPLAFDHALHGAFPLLGDMKI